jgi:hypothetical protein
MTGAGSGFDAMVGRLDGQLPVALLPVRLEARFVDDELRIRVFPDQVHLDSHEIELTAAERDAGTAYWQQRFAEPDPATRSSSPWATLCGVTGPARAAWVAQALSPVNLAQLGQPVPPQFPDTTTRPATWSRAVRAVALPQRWLVIGMRGGIEVCRKWGNAVSARLDVTPAPDLPAGPVDDDLPALQESARWLVDFDVAEQAGMAVRIGAAEVDGELRLGFDQLFVLGVDWTLDPASAAKSLRQLLTGHLCSDGLSALAAGTPTNVTAATRPGAPPGDDTLVSALDPERRPPVADRIGTGADRLWRSLGIALGDGDPLTAVPGGSGRAQDVASHLADVLWESTLGSYLSDLFAPVFPDTRTAMLRDHVRSHLFPGGPLPALRIARQPYGVLPVVSQTFAAQPGQPVEAGLATVLALLRHFWERAVATVPRLGHSADLDADLAAVLHTTPLTSAVRFRSVLGPLTVSATRGLDRHAVAQQYITSMIAKYLDVSPPTMAHEVTAHPGHERLDVPLAGPSSPAFLGQLAAAVRAGGSHDAIKALESSAAAVMDILAVLAVERELHRADLRIINGYRLSSGQVDALPAIGVLPSAEYVGVEAAEPPPPGSVSITTPAQASRLVIPSVTGQQTVREVVISRLATNPAEPDLAPLARILASLDRLAGCSAGELDLALRGLLDSYSHRLDAWYTSLAARRLAAVRTASASGVHLGGYGWLDDLRPAPGAGSGDGFIHAPSLGQAATAAVLRSGYLAHRDDEHRALQVDLTAQRVRTALALLDGVAQGQPLAALLGYRFERAVRERDLNLAQYLLPIRRMVPLRPDGAAAAAPTPSDNVAARDVVDGVALLERWRTEGPALFDALQDYVTWPPPPAEVFVMPPQPERDALAAELDRLADAYDAVADVLVAEAVHQNVLGNNERAGAALEALDRQGHPPRLEFVRTPRTGKSYTQRLLTLIGDEAVPAVWTSPVADARSAAEPRLNAWVARLIGNPRNVRFAATAPGAAWQLRLSLDQLGLSPLSAVMASHRPGRDAPSELEERLLHLFYAQLPAGTPASTALVLVEDPPRGTNPGTVGLGAFRALTRWIHTLITTHRPATAADLALPQDQADDGIDHIEVRARADALAAAHTAALAVLTAAVDAPAPTDQQLLDALWGAATFGVDGSVPPPPRPGGDAPDYHQELLDRAHDVAAAMAAVAGGGAPVGGDGPPRQRADQEAGRIRALLGAQFPVLPRFTAANAAALTASQGSRPALCAGDDLAPSSWLRRMALVRPGVERLARARSGAELVRSGVVPKDLTVVQLPHTPGERWLALPYPAATAPDVPVAPQGELAIVADCSGTVNFSAPLAGLFCDAWSETVPGRDETTGIALHHDAPGARPPQAILLAVPPTTDPVWTVEAVVATLTEAHQLARIRGVGPDTVEWLGTLLPAVLLPESVSPEFPVAGLKRLAETAATPSGGG